MRSAGPSYRDVPPGPADRGYTRAEFLSRSYVAGLVAEFYTPGDIPRVFVGSLFFSPPYRALLLFRFRLKALARDYTSPIGTLRCQMRDKGGLKESEGGREGEGERPE